MFLLGNGCIPDLIAAPFITAYVTRVVFNDEIFEDVRDEVFTNSSVLRDYSDVVHVSKTGSSDAVSACRYFYHDIRPLGTPWGVRLPLQCPTCHALQSWELLSDRTSLTVDDASCTKLTYRCRTKLTSALDVGSRPRFICPQIVTLCREIDQPLQRITPTGQGSWMMLPLQGGRFVTLSQHLDTNPDDLPWINTFPAFHLEALSTHRMRIPDVDSLLVRLVCNVHYVVECAEPFALSSALRVVQGYRCLIRAHSAMRLSRLSQGGVRAMYA